MDDKASVLLGELSRLKRRFEAIEALAPNCILTTERSTILSRYQARRSVPVHAPMPEMDLPAGYSRMIVPGNGCEISPKTISSFDELATAVVLYFPTGEPCVTVNREPMFKTAGWETNHQLTISGRDCHAVAKVIQAANHWCLGNRNWIQSIGLIPPVVKLDVHTLLWPDVVLALAERSTDKPRWMISVTAYTKISLSAWRNKSHREQLKEFTGSPWGISDEVVALIGDEPEDLHTTLDDFISQSVTAIDSLLKLAEMNANKIAPVVELADSLLSFTNAELMSELAKVIKTNKEKHWKANELRLKILECNPGRTTSDKSIEKNLVYQTLLETQGRKRKRKIDPDVLWDVVSQSLREHEAENGVRVKGRRIQSRD